MTQDELNAQQAEILAAQARDLTQQLQSTLISDEQKKKGGEVVGGVLEGAGELIGGLLS